MRSNKIKRLVILAVSAAVVLSILGLVQYFTAKPDLVVDNGDILVLRGAGHTGLAAYLSKYLNGGGYKLDIKNACIAGLLMLLISLRVSFLRKISS